MRRRCCSCCFIQPLPFSCQLSYIQNSEQTKTKKRNKHRTKKGKIEQRECYVTHPCVHRLSSSFFVTSSRGFHLVPTTRYKEMEQKWNAEQDKGGGGGGEKVIAAKSTCLLCHSSPRLPLPSATISYSFTFTS